MTMLFVTTILWLAEIVLGVFRNQRQRLYYNEATLTLQKFYDAVRDALVEYGKTDKAGYPSNAPTLVAPSH